jgi:L-fuconolactonase
MSNRHLPEYSVPYHTSRRRFLKHSAAVALCAGVTGTLNTPANAKENKDKAVTNSIPVVDTHQHLWDLNLVKLPWLTGAPTLNRNFVMSDYLAATKDANIAKTVYMEVNVDPSMQQTEAEYVIGLCEADDNSMAAAVIGGSPDADSFREYITPLARNKCIKGVRTVLHDPDRPKGKCLTDKFVAGVKLLGDLGLSFDLCMRPGEISDGVELARKCPGTRLIIDHCGNMSVTSSDQALRSKWMDGMKAAAQQNNTLCKISGIVVTAKKGEWTPDDLAPNLNFCMETFGVDRIFFGGDWPVCTLTSTYQQWINALQTIVKDRTPEFQRKLFHDNAVRHYGLK